MIVKKETKNEQSSQNGRNNEPNKARYWDHSGVVEDDDGVCLEAGVRESVVYNAHHVIDCQRGVEQTQKCEQNCSDTLNHADDFVETTP